MSFKGNVLFDFRTDSKGAQEIRSLFRKEDNHILSGCGEKQIRIFKMRSRKISNSGKFEIRKVQIKKNPCAWREKHSITKKLLDLIQKGKIYIY